MNTDNLVVTFGTKEGTRLDFTLTSMDEFGLIAGRISLLADEFKVTLSTLAAETNVSERTLSGEQLRAEFALGLPSPDARSRAAEFMERDRARRATERATDVPDRTASRGIGRT